MVTEHLLITITSCIVPTMRENRFLLFLNHLRLPYSIPKSFALLLAFHCARHSFATLLVRKNINPVDIAAMLGHASLKYVTRYARSANENKKTAIENMSNMFDL